MLCLVAGMMLAVSVVELFPAAQGVPGAFDHTGRPAVHTQRSLLEFYVTAGAVGGLLGSAILQVWLLSCAPEYHTHVVAELDTPRVQVDSTGFPQIYQRDEGAHLHLGVLLPGFASRERCMMTANCDSLRIVGEISNLEGPYEAVDGGNTVSGPFGPFERDVKLASPIDISTPVESRMGHGIFEFRFLKGYVPVAEP